MTIDQDHAKVKPLPIDLGQAKRPAPDESTLPQDIRKLLEKPGRVLCGDVDIRIDAKGQWYHEGGKINRKALVNLFSKVLYRDDDGCYWMVTPAEIARIEVEDAPFIGLELIDTEDSEPADQPAIKIRTNVDDVVPLDADHPIRVEVNPETGEPRPYIVVRDRLEALIARSVFYQLVEKSEEIEIDGAPVMGIWSNGIFFPLGGKDDGVGAGS